MTIAFPTEETTATPTTPTQSTACTCGALRGACTPQPKPLSPKKLAANRANAQKSTGPRTPTGKKSVSQNARTHGLSAEKAPDFTNHNFWMAFEELKTEHRPLTPTQSTLVREIAHTIWKLDQIPKIEFQLLDTPIENAQPPIADPALQAPIGNSQSAIDNPPRVSVPTIIAQHFQQNTPTPLTRIYAHQLRLQSKLTSLLHHLKESKREHQKQQNQDHHVESTQERSRRLAKDKAMFDEELNRVRERNRQQEQQARQQRIKENQPPLSPSPATPEQGQGESSSQTNTAPFADPPLTPSPGTPGEGWGEGSSRTNTAPLADPLRQSLASSRPQSAPAQIKPTNPAPHPQNPASPTLPAQIKPTEPPPQTTNPVPIAQHPSQSLAVSRTNTVDSQIKSIAPISPSSFDLDSNFEFRHSNLPPDTTQNKPTPPQFPRAKTPPAVYHAPPMLKTLPVIAILALLSFTNALRAADSPIDQLTQYLQTDAAKRPPLDKQSFATTPLNKTDAAAAQKLLWEDHVKQIRATRAQEMKDKKIVEGQLEMPFFYTIFGGSPKTGRSLFISMHGGGGAPKALNDSQWENQKHLYKPAEGVYLAPRAPTNTWNLWHESHIDRMFDRLIEDLIVFEDVDPNRVYIMGYSAGGDGVYQLAPRMADRFAAASMMAGHPNDAQPLGLRNLPFAIHVGALDAAYNRNKVAEEWGKKLDDLQKADPDGYTHIAKLHAGKAHWMDREDAQAVPWMAAFTRNPFPKKVAWKQASTTHTRFYWLAVPPDAQKTGAEITAIYEGQQITVQTKDVDRVIIRLNETMLDLNQPITVSAGPQKLFEGTIPRTIGTIAKTLNERGDPTAIFPAEVEVKVPAAAK